MMPNSSIILRWLVVPILLTAASGAAAAESTRAVIVVRHAERAGGMGADVGISDAGRCRAEVLAKMLADAGVNRIYTSEVMRTKQTAEPLARKLNIQPTVIPAKDIAALVEQLKQGPADGVSLVVGHSNTVPDIIQRLGGGAVSAIADGEYDRMFVVTFTGDHATTVRLHYAGCAQ